MDNVIGSAVPSSVCCPSHAAGKRLSIFLLAIQAMWPGRPRIAETLSRVDPAEPGQEPVPILRDKDTGSQPAREDAYPQEGDDDEHGLDYGQENFGHVIQNTLLLFFCFQYLSGMGCACQTCFHEKTGPEACFCRGGCPLSHNAEGAVRSIGWAFVLRVGTQLNERGKRSPGTTG